MKTFDCVAMQRKGAERVRRETAGMSKEEVLAYWQRGTEELLLEQAALRKKVRENVVREDQSRTAQFVNCQRIPDQSGQIMRWAR